MWCETYTLLQLGLGLPLLLVNRTLVRSHRILIDQAVSEILGGRALVGLTVGEHAEVIEITGASGLELFAQGRFVP